MLTTLGGYLILAVAFVVFVAVIIAVLVHDYARQIESMDDEGDESMATYKGSMPPAGGSKPFGPDPAPKGMGGGKTGRGGENKLPKHAMHARGRGRGMGKGCA